MVSCEKVPFSTIYFDGDILLNKASFALERRCYEIYRGEDVVAQAQNKKEALEIVETMEDKGSLEIKLKRWTEQDEILGEIIDNIISRTCRDLECGDYIVMLGHATNKDTFRHRAAYTVPYKGNRDPSGKPLLYRPAREYLLANHQCAIANDMEADDLLGIYLTRNPENTVVASIDKDLLQVPGWHYDLTTRKVVRATELGNLWLTKRQDNKRIDLKGTGFKWFCAQMLLGDSIDNIVKPKKGVGPKKIFNFFEGADTYVQLWNRVVLFYAKHADLDRLKENATLLWILRESNANYEGYINDKRK